VLANRARAVEATRRVSEPEQVLACGAYGGARSDAAGEKERGVPQDCSRWRNRVRAEQSTLYGGYIHNGATWERIRRMGEKSNLVFLHGMYMNSRSWTPWSELASARGYPCHAPSWPYHEGEPAVLRSRIDPALGSLTFGAVVEHLKGVIDALPERPLLVGHSVGGLLVQKLVSDGYARAGVCISSAPPAGVRSFDPHFFRSNFPHINPLAGNRPVEMTPKRFHYTFCNTMSREDSDRAFQDYVVPESRNVPRSTLGSQARIGFRDAHVPLLFVAGDRDHLTPLAMVKRNAAAYASSSATVQFEPFANRSHFICNQEGWEAVAEFCLDWLDQR
jgi:pimeloyl-ACP methyl ester carboxylesterase